MTAFAGRKSDIQLRANFLGEREAPAWMGASQGFGGLSDNEPVGGHRKAVKRGFWRERDLQRAIGVAKRARLDCYRIEIAPDGTISIVVGDPEDSSGRLKRRRP